MKFKSVSLLRGSRPALTRLIVRLSINFPFISASRRGGFSRNAGLLRLILGSAALAAAAGFALAESPAAAAATETVLYNFKGGNDGDSPAAGLIADSEGALYGTTLSGGGPADAGVVFKLTPPVPPATQWTKMVIYRFQGGSDGAHPQAGLIFNSNGRLFGTTSGGGTDAFDPSGTVFKLTPPVPPNTQWTKTTLHSFGTFPDGASPFAGLIFDSEGALYGTTVGGGTKNGGGTVFKLTPPAAGQTLWTETILFNFNNFVGTKPRAPNAGLILDSEGALYGTTYYGGLPNTGTNLGAYGTVFKLAGGALTVLYEFKGGNDGANPQAGLIFDSEGALYGTTRFGGGPLNDGVVFKLTPPVPPATIWTKMVLHRFQGGSDGANPVAGLIFNSKGKLFGTTGGGGTFSNGTAFKMTPPAPGQTLWTETVLHSFGFSPDGAGPEAGLVLSNGTLYGTTFQGGTRGLGTVFEVTP